MKQLLSGLDLGIIAPVLLLCAISLVTLFSVNGEFFKSQLIFLILSFIVLLFVSHLDYKLLRFQGKFFYIVSLVILTLLLFIGFESRGAVRWLDVFGFRIQFSEIFKPFLIVSLAAFLTSRDTLFRNFLLTFAFLFPVVFLIFKQPDLGSAIIYGSVTMLTMITYGFSLWYFFLGFVAVLIFLPFLFSRLHDYQKERLFTFITPGKDPLGTSYNAIQAVIAVGSGMFFGKGFSQGTQSSLRFLPERHTDFIFATLSEDLGFFGSLVLFACFAYLFYRIYLLFVQCDDPFAKMLVAASFFLLLIQFFVNVGMNIGLLPVVGVTLPFVSYGGSSLLSNFIVVGILCSVSKGIGKSRGTLEIR